MPLTAFQINFHSTQGYWDYLNIVIKFGCNLLPVPVSTDFSLMYSFPEVPWIHC